MFFFDAGDSGQVALNSLTVKRNISMPQTAKCRVDKTNETYLLRYEKFFLQN